MNFWNSFKLLFEWFGLYPVFQRQVGCSHLCTSSPARNGFLRVTSLSATPAELLVTKMACNNQSMLALTFYIDINVMNGDVWSGSSLLALREHEHGLADCFNYITRMVCRNRDLLRAWGSKHTCCRLVMSAKISPHNVWNAWHATSVRHWGFLEVGGAWGISGKYITSSS